MGNAARNPATGLTKKQDEFCFQVVVLGNPNKAYRVAYDNWTMSDGAVRTEVWKMLRDPKIEDRIGEFQAIAEQKLAVSIERIAKELACIGFAKITDIYDDQGNPIPFHLLPDDIARAVHSVTIVERQSVMPVQVDLDADGRVLGETKPAGATLSKDEKRAAKALKKLAAKALAEGATGIAFMPIREKKITLHDKQPALQTMAKWKRMIDQKVEDELDPNDVRALSDEQLEAEIKASDEALKTIAKARGRAKARTPAKAG